MNYHVPLISDKQYHIFNKSIGTDKFFLCDNDYNVFKRKYIEYIHPVVDTFSFNLLPNHFHLQVQIKSYEYLRDLFSKKYPHRIPADGWQPNFVMQQFSNMMNGYAKRFNTRYHRQGGLFKNYLRRLEIVDDQQFDNTLFYIHKNPVHHNYCEKIEHWPWSSYHEILADTPTVIQRKKILDWFGGREKFIQFHQQTIFLKNSIIFDL